MEEVKVIKVLNLVKEMFDYDDIDELIFGVDYSDEFNLFSERLNNIFSDGINEKCLNMLSKLEEKEIFYLEIGDEYINNDIRKKIVEYLDNQILYFDFENVKFMDSAGIGMILGRYKQLIRFGGKAEIININSDIKRIFNMVGIFKIIPIKECV